MQVESLKLRERVEVSMLQLSFNIRAAVISRTDFVVGNVGSLIQSASGVIAYLLLFTTLGGIGGWTPVEWCLVLGVVSTARGVWSVLFIGTLDLGELVRTGKLDGYLLRPTGSLPLVLLGRVSPDLWGEAALGVGLLGYWILRTDGLSAFQLVGIAIAVVIGVVIYASFYLVVESCSFWGLDTTFLRMMYERIDEFSRIPLSILPMGLQWVLIAVIPVAFIGYLPSSAILGRSSMILLGLGVVVAALVASVSVRVYSLGVRRYSSAG